MQPAGVRPVEGGGGRSRRSWPGRTAGAVTLALGMAKVLADLPGMRPLMAYLYHFVIMFEALFILTLLETGTRVARFILQECWPQFRPQAGAEPRAVLDPQRGRQRRRLLPVGISALHVRDRPAVADDGHRQPTAGGDRAGRRHHLSVEALAEAGVRPVHRRFPFVVVAVTVFTAGVQSVQLWWQQAGDPDPAARRGVFLPADVRLGVA